MGNVTQPTFRFILILLAGVNLAIWGVRLWPWREVFNLPDNGVAGIAPAVCLLAYIGVISWAGDARQAPIQKELAGVSMVGGLAGFLVVLMFLLLASPVSAEFGQSMVFFYLGLLFFAGLLLWHAGEPAAKAGGSLLFGAWSGMVSSLVVCTAVLAGMRISLNYAIYTVLLFHSFLTTLLLFGPLAGGVLGLLSGLKRKG